MLLPSFRLFEDDHDRDSSLRRRLFFVGTVLVSCVLYLIVIVHTPLSVRPTAGHDDGLFMKLGRFFAQGEWFGPYNNFTLKVGPGYPVFLAFSSWLGLPVSAAHALFHGTAVGLFAWIVRRISRSPFLGLVVFLLTLWHPVFHADRIVRAAIYPGQVLLLLACFSYALFVTERPARRLLGGVAAGLILVWCWLTREEGVVLLPGLGFLLLFATVRAWRARAVVQAILVPVAPALVLFLVVQLAFQFGNWVAYGSFVGVDFKERNFQAALTALRSVREGERIPYVPVSRAARMRIYAVSPAFASLKEYIDPPTQEASWQQGCLARPSTCGDIAVGFFMWILRGAAASRGHYETPARASAFFGTLAREVQAACRDGRLVCKRPLISYMPPVTQEQLEAIPASAVEALARLSFVRRPDFNPHHRSWGGEGVLTQALAFLNHPLHWPSPDVGSHFVFRGWYYAKADTWFRLDVMHPDSTPALSMLERRASPDLARHFDDPQALQQRFLAETNCQEACTLVVTGADGATLRIAISELMDEKSRFALSGGVLYFDLASKEGGYVAEADVRVKTAGAVRTALIAGYELALPVLLGLGFLAFIVGLALAWKKRTFSPLMALATTTWILLATRLALLVLIDISSFPGFRDRYLAPAFYLSVAAALVSIGAVVTIWKQARSQRNVP